MPAQPQTKTRIKRAGQSAARIWNLHLHGQSRRTNTDGKTIRPFQVTVVLVTGDKRSGQPEDQSEVCLTK